MSINSADRHLLPGDPRALICIPRELQGLCLYARSIRQTRLSTDRLGEGAIVREPDKPSAPDLSNRDWTAVEEKQVEEEKEPPKKPIHELLLEHIQSMWRASAMAVEQFQKVSETDQVERNKPQVKDESPTYSEPKVKRTERAVRA